MVNSAIFVLIIFVTFIIQSITGFAGTVLAMPFSMMLVGYAVAEPVLNIVGIASSVMMLFFCFKKINRREFLKISLVMLVGIAVGLFLKESSFINASLLYKILGVTVIFFAVLNIYKFARHKQEHEHSTLLSSLILLAAGFVHGLFVCGGPFLVIYAGGKMKDKDEFRATLFAVWIVLNTIILIEDIALGNITVQLLPVTAAACAALVLAVIAGNALYKKMSKKVFLCLTYALMLISGISLLAK